MDENIEIEIDEMKNYRENVVQRNREKCKINNN